MTSRLLSTITITPRAWNKMADIIKKQNAYSFMFSAVGGGCNGYNYNLKLLDDKQHDIMYKEFSSGKFSCTILQHNNSKVIIDPISEMSLIGTTIDYLSENYSKGCFENKFVFIADKKLATTCGCGISFTPKK